MSKLGCSSRLGIILIIVLTALFLASFITGPVGSKFFNVSVPPEFQVSAPHVMLPSEAMFHVGDFKITNTLICSWITMILLFLLFFIPTRNMKMIPGRGQNFVEVIVEGVYGAVQGISGEKHVRTFFPLIATIFLYIVVNALMGLLPIYGTWGPIETVMKEGHNATVVVPFLRNANTDINLPISIALVSFFFIEYQGFSKVGPLHYIDSFFQFSELGKAFKELFKGNSKAFVSGLAFGFINIYVGLLEILSHLIRIISFTFRLFGNMTAGEILLGVMTFLVAFVVPSIFYFFETFFGFLQALIFAGLTLVWGVMAITPHHEEGAEHN